MATERDSNMELLRIISMLLIVAHHYAYFGINDYIPHEGAPFLMSDTLHFLGPCGMFCFVTISGYFMLNSRFTLRKLLRLWSQTWVSSALVLLAFLLVLTPAEPITSKMVGKALLPVVRKEYWFVTSFIILMLCSPFLNAAFRRFGKGTMAAATGGMLVALTAMQLFGVNSRFIMFLMLYCCGAWLRLYDRKACSARWPLLGALATWGLYRGIGWWVHGGHEMCVGPLQVGDMLIRVESPLTTVAAIFMMMAFARMRIGQLPRLNAVAACTFGVYLFHQHPITCDWLWKSVFTDVSVTAHAWFPLYAAGVTLLVFSLSALADALRRHSLDKLSFALIDRYIIPGADKATEWVKQRLCRRSAQNG